MAFHIINKSINNSCQICENIWVKKFSSEVFRFHRTQEFHIGRVIRLGWVLLEASDRSVAHTRDLVRLGTLSHCGGLPGDGSENICAILWCRCLSMFWVLPFCGFVCDLCLWHYILDVQMVLLSRNLDTILDVLKALRSLKFGCDVVCTKGVTVASFLIRFWMY